MIDSDFFEAGLRSWTRKLGRHEYFIAVDLRIGEWVRLHMKISTVHTHTHTDREQQQCNIYIYT